MLCQDDKNYLHDCFISDVFTIEFLRLPRNYKYLPRAIRFSSHVLVGFNSE